jgi:DNA-binding GntR family transcriptional regulator
MVCVRQHEQLVALLEASDPEGASALMRARIVGLGEAFLEWWDHTCGGEHDD